MLDLFLTANSLLLIMLKDTGDASFPSRNVTLSDVECSSDLLPVNYGLVIFYYVPIATFVLCFILALALLVKRCVSRTVLNRHC